MGDGEFFDVHPRRWDLEGVLELLERVKDVEVAVLPELSLDRPDALEQALSKDPARYPRLVIAGSAHVRERTGSPEEVRANEARIYLDGELVGRHRKSRAYIATKKGSFNGPIADLASRRQAVCVVANAPPAEATAPFHCMVAAPQEDPDDQSRAFPRDGDGEPTRIAVFDPNKKLDEAVSWR